MYIFFKIKSEIIFYMLFKICLGNLVWASFHVTKYWFTIFYDRVFFIEYQLLSMQLEEFLQSIYTMYTPAMLRYRTLPEVQKPSFCLFLAIFHAIPDRDVPLFSGFHSFFWEVSVAQLLLLRESLFLHPQLNPVLSIFSLCCVSSSFTMMHLVVCMHFLISWKYFLPSALYCFFSVLSPIFWGY